jgi:5-oxoprolinase (ATP-hydrolysing)
MTELRQRTLGGVELEPVLAGLAAEAEAALRAQGAQDVVIGRRAALRYEGSDTALEVAVGPEMRDAFETLHRTRFGFVSDAKIVVETAIVEVRASPERGGDRAKRSEGYQRIREGLTPLHHAPLGPSTLSGDELYDLPDLAPWSHRFTALP